MSNETDDDKHNINSSYDSQDIRLRDSPNSRLSSASKKNQEQRSTLIKNSLDNQSLNDSVNHEEQPSVNNHSHSSFNVNDDEQIKSSTDFNDHRKPPTPPLDDKKVDDSVLDHSACQFRPDKKWLDLQFHENKTDNKTDESEMEIIKKPNELEDEMEDPPGEIDEDLLNRIEGSIIGMTLGDSLGAHVEFRPHEYMVENPVKDLEGGGTWGLEIGQFTDDTSMALCLANSLIARRDFVPYDQLVRYKWWSLHGYMSSTGHCFDIGAATSQSIHEFQVRQKHFGKKHEIPPKKLDYLSDPELLSEFDVYCSDPDAAGNGSLMRLAPVPLFFYRNKYAAIEFSGRSGEVTHGNKKAYDACRFYGALIVAALRGFTKKQILAPNFYSKHRHWFGEEPLCQEIISIAEGSYKRTFGYEGGIRGKGYVVQALEAALWAFWSDGDLFKTGVLNAVNLGDDTDTTAAIYGQLAGAYYGYKKLPQNWVQHLYGLKYMRTLSKWIAYEGEQWDKNRENSFVKGSIGRN